MEAVGLTGMVQDRRDETGQTGGLVMSYLQPPYRGRGLSRLLYQARLDWAIAQTNWTTLVVSCRAGNEASRRANQTFGFQLVSKEPIIWPDGAEADEWKYRLDLAALRNA